MRSKAKEIKTSALDSTISMFVLEKDSEKPDLAHLILKGEMKKFHLFPLILPLGYVDVRQ